MRALAPVLFVVIAACGSFGADPTKTDGDAGVFPPPDASALADAGSDASVVKEPCDTSFCSSFDVGAAPWSWTQGTEGFPFAFAPGSSAPNALVVSAKGSDAPHFLSWRHDVAVTFVSIQMKLDVRTLPSTPSSDAMLVKIGCAGTQEFGALKLKPSGALQVQGSGSSDAQTQKPVALDEWLVLDFRWDLEQKNLSLLGELPGEPISVNLEDVSCPSLTVSLGMVDFHGPHTDEYRVLFDDVRIDTH